MDMTAYFFVFAIPAVIFAGISKGGFGSGAAFASSSFLAIILEPGFALALMLPLLMLVDLASLKPYWGRWNLRDSALLLVGGLPGVMLGTLLYRAVNADAMRVMIGVISVGFVVWQMSTNLRKNLVDRPPMPEWAGALAGVVAGFTSFVSHAGGPPAAVYMLGRRMSKTEYQASTVLVFGVLNSAKLIPYGFLGLFTLETLQLDLILAPFALIGAWIGVNLHHKMPEKAFFALTYVLLTCTGVKLIWDGLT
ncbi:sulfite exporter TauE/SafE family protein [Parasedimentitalea psychrophila]|uniref:Probable membrane transporter protein n=2 Tax=Parasedimentitalea psychrophila TaxID=2997337 RepID=A0A9Y2KZB1_9RHOB|nr:sulfite exporter TauE/SafE family protein [Parasedimentitalea psychrophila]WIY25871.1 sulfite exporter TauE/SafE family protein [Parasedimentitalea psychrophila]